MSSHQYDLTNGRMESLSQGSHFNMTIKLGNLDQNVMSTGSNTRSGMSSLSCPLSSAVDAFGFSL